MDSITRISASFLLYLAIMIMVFYMLGGPLDTIFDSLEGIDTGESADELDTYMPVYKTAMRIGFALGIAAAPTWFGMKVFSREPAYYRRRRF